MFILNCFIEIKTPDNKVAAYFNYVNEIEVVTSTQNFTDTAKVLVPRKLKYKGKSITEFIKRNYLISIATGYGIKFDLDAIFKGYIKSVSNGTPIVIECENEAWKLKQIKLPAKYYPKLMLSAFVKEWMPTYTTKIAETNFGPVRIDKDTSLAKVFDYFMTNHPVKFYFRDDIFYGVLPGALAVGDDTIRTIKFKLGYNTISDNLVYTLKEDVKLQIVVKCITRENKKLEYKEPKDSDNAEIRTFLKSGAESVDELKVYAKDMLKRFKIDKMTGDFTAFGEPLVRKGDLVHLFDEDRQEMDNKKFIADALTYSFGQGGYRQKITLGAQIHE
jgi:hypothetical protein